MIKVPKTRFLAFALCAAMVLVFWQGKTGLAWDKSDCIVKLPPNCLYPPSPVQVTDLFTNELDRCADILDPSNRSYFDTTIDVPPGFSIVDGTYDGWCVDLVGDVVQNDEFGANLFSSLDAPTAPEITRDISEEEWNQINCILNDETVDRNWIDEQAAIWTIVEGEFPSDFPFGDFPNSGGCPGNGGPAPNQAAVNDLLDLADTDFCRNFKPTAGQAAAVVVQALKNGTCVPDPVKQINIIEAECCKFIKKLVSVDGGETFVDADTVDTAAIEDGKGAIYKIIVTNCGDKKITAKVEDVDLGFFSDPFDLEPGDKKYFVIDEPNVCDDFVCDSDSDSDSDSDIDIDCDSDSNGDGCNGEVEKVCKENVAELLKDSKIIDDDPAWVCCDCDFDGDSDSDSDNDY